MSFSFGNAELRKVHLAVRWLGIAFLLWEAMSSTPRIFSQPVSNFLGLEVCAVYFLVCSGFVYATFSSSVSVLIGYDLLIGSILLFLYGGAWPFVLPFFFATYAAATCSWSLSLAISLAGGLLFLGARIYSEGVREELLVHPEWFLFFVLSFAISTLGLFRFESMREKEKGESLIGLIEAGQFGSALSYDDLFKMTQDVVRGIFSATTFAVYLKDDTGVLKLQGAQGLDADRFVNFDPREVKTLLADVVNRRSTLVVEDVQALKEEQEKILPKSPQIRAAMAVPLVFANECIGLLFVATPGAKVYDKESVRLLTIIANQAAVSYGNVKLHEKASLLAATDSVSGLFTYGYLQEFLDREFHRCKYANLPISAVILDVDEFKKVNEASGHAMGDSLLRQLGVVIKGVTRVTDVVCRYAGDEFVVVLPETNRIGAMLVAERIRQTVADYDFVAGSNIIRLTICGGVASYPEDVETRKELTEKAELSLAEAKTQGHDKVSS